MKPEHRDAFLIGMALAVILGLTYYGISLTLHADAQSRKGWSHTITGEP